MAFPITPSNLGPNTYDPSWFERDFLHTTDGAGEFPEHHCKATFQVAFPHIRRFRHAIDVGCRDGEFTRYLQHHFRHTYGFDPRQRKCFARNVDVRKVTHFTCALGDEPGRITMNGGTHDPSFRARSHVVPCHTLDSFGLDQVDFIKIDVEGFERKVLLGGQQTIERDRPVIVIEQNDVRLPGEPPMAAKRWLEERGYRHVATCPRGWDYVMTPD